jgi:hypothetical protein
MATDDALAVWKAVVAAHKAVAALKAQLDACVGNNDHKAALKEALANAKATLEAIEKVAQLVSV